MGDFMEEEIIEEFNERFATIEESLKYIADSQAKSEFNFARMRKLQEQTQKQIDLNQKQIEHIIKCCDLLWKNVIFKKISSSRRAIF
jgi:galactokinase